VVDALKTLARVHHPDYVLLEPSGIAQPGDLAATVRAYAEALQKKDAAAVLALVAPDFYDTAGTPGPEDDLDRAGLERTLAADLARIDSLRVDVGVKRIEVNGDQAFAELFYETYFRVATPNGPVPRRESDLHLMKLRRVGTAWLITSGL